MMSANRQSPPARRKPWNKPLVERLAASAAENAYSVQSRDNIYSTS